MWKGSRSRSVGALLLGGPALFATGCLAPTDPLPPVVEVPSSAIHALGTSDLLNRIIDLVPMDDGSMWILNGVDPFFVHLSPEGSVLETAGRAGQGPGEFGGPTTLFPVPEGAGVSAWSYEPRAHGLGQASLRPVPGQGMTGQSSGEVAITLPQELPGPEGLVSTDDLGMGPGRPWIRGIHGPSVLFAVAPSEVRGAARLWSAGIVELRPDGTVQRRAELSDLLHTRAPEGSGPGMLGPHPLWAVCPDERLLIYDPAANALLRGVDGEGWEGQVELPAPRSVPVTGDRVFRVMQEREMELSAPDERMDSVALRRAFELDFQQFRSQLSPVFAEYAELHCPATDEFWIRLVEPDRGVREGHRWYRARGGDLTLVEFPPLFEAMVFETGRLWGVHRDQLDRPVVAWLDLDFDEL